MTAPMALAIMLNGGVTEATISMESRGLENSTLILVLCSISAWIAFSLFNFRAASRLEFLVISVVGKTKLVWAVFLGIIILREEVALSQVIGVVLIGLAATNVSLFGRLVKPDPVGILYASAAAAALALALFFDKILVESMDPAVVIFLGFLGTFLFSLVINRESFGLFARKMVLVASLAAICGVLGYYLLLLSMKSLPLSVAVPLYQCSFVLDMIIAVVILGERNDLMRKAISGVGALCGVLLVVGI